MTMEDALEAVWRAQAITRAACFLRAEDLADPTFGALCKQSFMQTSQGLAETYEMLQGLQPSAETRNAHAATAPAHPPGKQRSPSV